MKIGIATENWKVPEFEKALAAAGFKFTTTLGESSFRQPVAAIVVECEPNYEQKVHALCVRLQAELFHRRPTN